MSYFLLSIFLYSFLPCTHRSVNIKLRIISWDLYWIRIKVCDEGVMKADLLKVRILGLGRWVYLDIKQTITIITNRLGTVHRACDYVLSLVFCAHKIDWGYPGNCLNQMLFGHKFIGQKWRYFTHRTVVALISTVFICWSCNFTWSTTKHLWRLVYKMSRALWKWSLPP
jgi:hypothetical protein